MANDEQIVLRVPTALLERVTQLERQLGVDPAGNTRSSRSAVLRLALARGLDALEAEHPVHMSKTDAVRIVARKARLRR